jgi:hypothetical protein
VEALWHHEIVGRPCTLVTAARLPDPIVCPRLVAEDSDFSAALATCDQYLESHAFLGEAMPAFRPGFGPDQMAAFLGAPLSVSNGDGPTSWAQKIVQDWRVALPLRIEPDNRYYRRMREFHAAATEHLAGRCLLSEIDMHSNIDLLEALRGAQNLLFDMMDDPGIVHEAMAQARDIYAQVYETFYRYGAKQQWGTTSALPMYDHGRFNRIQADFIALLSPSLFREFVLPAIEEEAHYLDRSCFHLDGPDALVHVDDLLTVKDIDAVQWVPGAGRKPAIEWPDVLHRIQNAGKIIILHLCTEDVKRIHGQYDPTLVVYDVRARTVDEGLELLRWLEANT